MTRDKAGMRVKQQRTFVDFAAKELPEDIWAKLILPHLKDEKDIGSVNRVNKMLYRLTFNRLSTLKYTRFQRYEAERERILKTFAHPLEEGYQIKFKIEGEPLTRTGTVAKDFMLDDADNPPKFTNYPYETSYPFHHVTVQQDDGKIIQIKFGIRVDLQTVFPNLAWLGLESRYDIPNAFKNATVVNDDLVAAQRNCNILKRELVGDKLDKFSKCLKRGDSLTITFSKGNYWADREIRTFTVTNDVMETYCDDPHDHCNMFEGKFFLHTTYIEDPNKSLKGEEEDGTADITYMVFDNSRATSKSITSGRRLFANARLGEIIDIE